MKARFILYLIIFSTSTVYSQLNYQEAYDNWINTYEASGPVLRMAKMAELLGNYELADELQDNLFGTLEEKAIIFLNADIPSDKCDKYILFLIKIGAVVGDLLSPDLGCSYSIRILEILDACKFGISDIAFPEVQWESSWEIRLEYRKEDMPNSPGHYDISDISGEFKIPDCLPLSEFVGPKEEFDQMLRIYGKDTTLAFIKAFALTDIGMMDINGTLNGTHRYWKDAFNETMDEGRWVYNTHCPGCPEHSVACNYKLLLSMDIESSEYYVRSELISNSEVNGIGDNCVRTITDTQDGSVTTETWVSPCFYNPIEVYNSYYWDSETVPLKDGAHIVDQYETYSEIRITLKCIDNCN